MKPAVTVCCYNASGELFWRSVAYVSLVELFVEAFRANTQTWLAGVRITQIVALLALVVALYVLSFYAQQRAGKDSTSPQQLLGEENDRDSVSQERH